MDIFPAAKYRIGLNAKIVEHFFRLIFNRMWTSILKIKNKNHKSQIIAIVFIVPMLKIVVVGFVAINVYWKLKSNLMTQCWTGSIKAKANKSKNSETYFALIFARNSAAKPKQTAWRRQLLAVNRISTHALAYQSALYQVWLAIEHHNNYGTIQ